MRVRFSYVLLAAWVGLSGPGSPAAATPAPQSAAARVPSPSLDYSISEGYVEANGFWIYYKAFGRGAPLVILHGGPGASHDYLLPHLAPLGRRNRLVFIDERGSGRSTGVEDAKQYTIENMVEDVEAVRIALRLGRINLLGHSYGGALAQAYALKYQKNLSHLVLCSTFSSTKAMNQVFVRMKESMAPELRSRIERMEKEGLFGKGRPFERGRYPADYMTASWGEGYFPYLYRNRPDPNFDPIMFGVMSWELYRTMWGSSGEFVIDGNLVSVEYDDRLGTLTVPTLITVGDHDQCDPSLSRTMEERIAGSKLVVLPESGHMTFVDQPGLFMKSVDEFLHPSR